MLRWLSVRITKLCFRALRDGSAVVSPLMALMIIPIAGATAMATEMGQWYYFQRAMQNAADAAALAAAINDSDNYASEASGAAREFGFIQGQDNTTVQPQAPVPCPDLGINLPDDTCYQVNLSKTLPITFSALVGFRGDANSGFAQTIRSSAVATTAGGALTKTTCLWSLGPGTSLDTNGTPKADLTGCSVFSNGDANCAGNGLSADFAFAVGSITGSCATSTSNQKTGQTPPTDNFAALKDKIPSDPCSGNYPERQKKDPILPSGNLLGSTTTTLPKTMCGDVQLTGDVTLSGDNTLVIYNGTLDLNGHVLRTADKASVTLIFAGNGTKSSTTAKQAVDATRGPTDSSSTQRGGLDITAPTSGDWAGVAVYQKPGMGAPQAWNLDLSYKGNAPFWKISGAVYLPDSNVNFGGIPSKATHGTNCFVLVAYTIRVNGTGIIANSSDCDDYGFDPPDVVVGSALRERLVR